MLQGLPPHYSTMLECFTICEQTIPHSLDLGGENASRSYITTLQDCAESCAGMIPYMARESPLHRGFARLCADACDRCAEACERLAGDDELTQRCADICRRCAQECREMAAAA